MMDYLNPAPAAVLLAPSTNEDVTNPTKPPGNAPVPSQDITNSSKSAASINPMPYSCQPPRNFLANNPEKHPAGSSQQYK